MTYGLGIAHTLALMCDLSWSAIAVLPMSYSTADDCKDGQFLLLQADLADESEAGRWDRDVV